MRAARVAAGRATVGPHPPASERTIALVLEYDGFGLSGWQRQENAPSIQEHLERALARMLGGEVAAVGASRTDAGVHAEGQVAHFRTANASIPERGFRRGLNSLLPAQIAVLSAVTVAPSFHARFSAREKRYRYELFTRPERSPLLRARAWHRPRDLDLDAMRSAASALTGRHDFSAFRAAGCGARHPVRTLRAVEIGEVGPERIAIEVRGDAFLRNMVRILAGTLVEVGEAKRSPDDVTEVLTSRDRRRAGATAPAHGLTLVEVSYDSTAWAPSAADSGLGDAKSDAPPASASAGAGGPPAPRPGDSHGRPGACRRSAAAAHATVS